MIVITALLTSLWVNCQARAIPAGVENATTWNGAIYYVAPNGDDSNPGTFDKPWKTIQKAANTLAAGDTVYIRAGTYHERVEPQNSGSAGKPILYAAYPGDLVTLDGSGVDIPEWGGLFDVTNQSYITVSGLRVMHGRSNTHNPGILADTSSQIVFKNNTVQDTNDSGIAAWNSDHILIEGNDVSGCCRSGYNETISVGVTDVFVVKGNHVHDSPKEGICTKDGSSNGDVYGNYVHHTQAVGIYVDAQDKHTHNIEVFQNVVHDVSADGIALASEQGGLLENIQVYNNIAYSNKWVGLHVSDCCIATHPMQNLTLINNSLYRNGWDPWGGGIAHDNPQASNVIIRNNIGSQNLSFQITVAAGIPAANYAVDHNLIDGYRSGEGEIYGDDYVEGDPRFINPAAANFHLPGYSPAVDRGSPSGAPARDFDGQARPCGAGYDIGADEFHSGRRYLFLPVLSR